MGPLIGNYIDTEFNYLIAILIGMAFGYILEQAGFSTSRKLAGVFYGYDFVVLRVFFTAAATTVLGVIFLEHFGMLDANQIYINPTYLKPAIVGGVIMGLGFILGGFCPGTSVSALSIGKIDAMVFFLGLIVGAFLFVEGFPLFSDFYKSDYQGELMVYESIGMSRGWFAFMFVMIAIFSFIATYLIEQKVNGTPVAFNLNLIKNNPNYTAAIIGTIIVAGLVAFMPNRDDFMFAKAEKQNLEEIKEEVYRIKPDELAFKLLDKDESVLIIDLRQAEDYSKAGLPSSVNIPYSDIMDRSWQDVFDQHEKAKIFVANDEATELKAFYICMKHGYRHFYILCGGYKALNDYILNPTEQAMSTLSEEQAAYAKNAGPQLKELIANSKKTVIKPKAITKVKGGC